MAKPVIYDETTGLWESRLIQEADIQDGAVTVAKIGDGAVTNAKIASGAVTDDKIAANAVLAGHIASGQIQSQHIGALQVTTTHLDDAAVTTAKIADFAVASGKIAANAVDDTALATGAVVSGKIATAAVNTDNITDLAVTSVKLADSAVTTAKVADGAITYVKLNVSGQIKETDLDPNISINVAETIQESLVAAEPISGGNCVAIDANGRAVNAVALIEGGKMPAIGVAKEAAASGATVYIKEFGELSLTEFNYSGYTGNLLYVPTSPGQPVVAAPKASGDIQQKIAIVKSASGILINPSFEMVEITT